MKMQKKKLLFILILVVSIMAIIITASQVYEIVSNEKIIDNNINGITGEENEYKEDSEQLVQEGISSGNFLRSYNSYGEWTNTSSNYRSRYRVQIYYYNEGEYNLKSNNPIIYNTIFLTYSGRVADNSGTEEVIERTGHLQENIESIDYTVNDVPSLGSLNDVESAYEYSTSIIKRKTMYIISEENPYSFHTVLICAGGVQYYLETQQYQNNTWVDFSSDHLTEYGAFTTGTQTLSVVSNTSNVNSFEFSYGENPKISIDSNELLQTTTTINNKKLSQYIYEKITAEWGEGKELATLKCSIGEYYDEEGNLAISTKQNDLPMLFDIGDLVIPYIAVADGKTEPLSIKLDGTPKVFKVTQIRPYFDGAFWQEITLQEQTT